MFSVMVLFIYLFIALFWGPFCGVLVSLRPFWGCCFSDALRSFLGGEGGGRGGRFPEVSVSFRCQKERNGVVTFWGSRADILGPFRSILGHFNPF